MELVVYGLCFLAGYGLRDLVEAAVIAACQSHHSTGGGGRKAPGG